MIFNPARFATEKRLLHPPAGVFYVGGLLFSGEKQYA
jgi:hypothetical protein